MRRYLIQHPRIAPCITWGDTPEAALASARELTGCALFGATAEPFTPSAYGALDQHLAHPRLANPPTTDED